jgi:hypothetical protein
MGRGNKPQVVSGYDGVQVAEAAGVAGGWGVIQPVEGWRLLIAERASWAGRSGDGGKEKGGEQH